MQNTNKTKEQQWAEWDEQIARFLRRKMSEDEAAAFRQQLAEDDDLRQRASLQASMIRQMKEVGMEQSQRVANAMRTLTREEAETMARGKGKTLFAKKKTLMQRLTPWISVAAVLCCVLIVGRVTLGPHMVRKVQYYAHSLFQPKQTKPAKNKNTKPSTQQQTQLEQLALLRGKIEMGIDVKSSTQQLQKMFDQACKDDKSIYKDHINDIANTLLIGYNMLNDQDAAFAVYDQLRDWDDIQMAHK